MSSSDAVHGPTATDDRRDEEATENATTLREAQISSPHELTDWVDNVLNTLESRFTSMSSQVEGRLKEMSERIDALESSIEELITGAVAPTSNASKSTHTKAEGGPHVSIADG